MYTQRLVFLVFLVLYLDFSGSLFGLSSLGHLDLAFIHSLFFGGSNFGCYHFLYHACSTAAGER